MTRRFILALVVTLAGSNGSALSSPAMLANAQLDDTRQVVDRAARYVTGFVSRFSNVVAEELYVQQRLEGVVMTQQRRELTSDFLFVRASDTEQWLVFRDVRLVNGREVRNRGNRLLEFFTSSSDQVRALADALTTESQRHGLSNWPIINNPLIALSLLQDQYRDRFVFSLNRPTSEREGVVLQFREHVRPTLLRTRNGDVFLEGGLWIDSQTGRISRTELAIGRHTTVTTIFDRDEELQMDVPVEMRERYSTLYSTGLARYSNFRTFQIQTNEIMERDSIP